MFISYAQNQEDVMLYRALSKVQNGFYLDVGAQDPVIDSVTKAFYERGWHGVNVEPIEEYFQKLRADRPHDINLQTAVGREAGAISFYEIVHTGLSTSHPEYARRHSEAGYEVRSTEVPCTTLDVICAEYNIKQINFLKVDAEGSERAVLEGFSFDTVRPWIVVVEATEPNTDRPVFTDWEKLLTSHDYHFVYFDGLNRFYIAEEHRDLDIYFATPPNPFDEYVGYRLWRTQADLDQIRSDERSAFVNTINHLIAETRRLDFNIQTLRQRVGQKDTEIRKLHERLQNVSSQLAEEKQSRVNKEQRLRELRSSFSWKVTRPLREFRRAGSRCIRLFRRPVEQKKLDKLSGDLIDQVEAELTEPARIIYRKLRAGTPRE